LKGVMRDLRVWKGKMKNDIHQLRVPYFGKRNTQVREVQGGKSGQGGFLRDRERNADQKKGAGGLA